MTKLNLGKSNSPNNGEGVQDVQNSQETSKENDATENLTGEASNAVGQALANTDPDKTSTKENGPADLESVPENPLGTGNPEESHDMGETPQSAEQKPAGDGTFTGVRHAPAGKTNVQPQDTTKPYEKDRVVTGKECYNGDVVRTNQRFYMVFEAPIRIGGTDENPNYTHGSMRDQENGMFISLMPEQKIQMVHRGPNFPEPEPSDEE